jgi:hypothetical protein
MFNAASTGISATLNRNASCPEAQRNAASHNAPPGITHQAPWSAASQATEPKEGIESRVRRVVKMFFCASSNQHIWPV